MLKTILSITGKPGLFKIVSNGKNMLLVEDITTHKRFPAHARDKIVSLGDISMYTDADDVPLGEIFEKAKTLYDGKPVDLKAIIKAGALRDEFAKVLPDFDRERVYDGDIKKFFSWYNLLLAAGLTDFLPAPAEDTPAEDPPAADPPADAAAEEEKAPEA